MSDKSQETSTKEPPVPDIVPDPACSAFNIPARLHRAGRAAIPDFTPEELLYRWFVPTPGTIEEGWIWSPMSGDMSTNRQRYSERPDDVLYDTTEGEHRFDKAEIATFRVDQIEQIIMVHPNDGSKIYRLKVIHSPEPCMYPHSHAEVLLNGQVIPANKLPKSLRTALRRKLTVAYTGNTGA